MGRKIVFNSILQVPNCQKWVATGQIRECFRLRVGKIYLLRHGSTDCVHANVIFVRPAKSVTEPTRQRGRRTDLQRISRVKYRTVKHATIFLTVLIIYSLPNLFFLGQRLGANSTLWSLAYTINPHFITKNRKIIALWRFNFILNYYATECVKV